MAFLQCHSDFSPLFRLLDNYNNYETHAGPKATTHSTKSHPVRRTTFTPSFDVREGSDGYFLDGELPGIDQSNIEIEFSDPQTLIVKGRTERNYQLHQPQAQAQEQAEAQTSSPSSPSLHATVEDDDEDYDAIHSDAGSTDSKRQREEQLVQPEPEPQAQAQAAETEADDFHFWASERSIGEFQRTFAFSARVDQDGVRASLKNGILSIYVPKLALPKTKKIRILWEICL